MSIKVKLHGRVRVATGSDEVELNSNVGTVGELLLELSRKLGPDATSYIFEPGTSRLHPTLILLVNGHSVKMLEGLRTRLVERDEITVDNVDILETVGGG